MKHPLESLLESLKKPDVSAPLHESALKRGLLASKKAKSFFIPMNLFKLLPAGVAVALVMALLLHAPSGTSIDPFVAPKASAQELIMQVSNQIQSLTSEEVAALEASLGYSGTPVSNILQEAQLADDLRDLPLTEETLIGDDGKEYCVVPMENLQAFVSDQPNCISRFEDLRSVIFTSSENSIVVVMVDDDLLPAAIFTFQSVSENEQSMTIFGSQDSPFSFSNEEEAFHFATFNCDRNLSFEENMAQSMEGISSVFEQYPQIPEEQDVNSETVTVDPITGCTSWTSEDGQMGGGGC